MPIPQRGFAHLLLLIPLVIVVLVAIGIPLVVSKAILPRVKQETAGEFPAGNLAAIKEYVDKNSEPWVQSKGQKYMGYETPTEGELQSLKKGTDLTRRYPTSIKAVFDPGAISNTIDLRYVHLKIRHFF